MFNLCFFFVCVVSCEMGFYLILKACTQIYQTCVVHTLQGVIICSIISCFCSVNLCIFMYNFLWNWGFLHSGPENHAPHLCHKCGWPFPNPHPSARHRRSHKKVCGKIEGYKLSESETADNSTHSSVSDDEHHSDGDQQTPSE